MVLPDGEPGSRRSSNKSLMPLVGSAALVIGLIALLSLTRPDPALVAALAETTTTSPSTTTTVDLTRPIDFENFSVDQIEQGEQFEWQKVLEIDDHWGLDMVWTGERLHVFGVEGDPFEEASEPLAQWMTTDGSSWTNGGSFGHYNRYSNVTTAPGGLAIAAGHENGLTLAISQDGWRWDETEIELELGDFYSVGPGPIAVTDTIQVISFNEYLAVEQRLKPTIESHLDLHLPDAHGSITWRAQGADDMVIDVFGPFGIPFARLSGSELGLGAKSMRQANARPPLSDWTQVWARTGDEQWRKSEIRGMQWLESLVALPDNSILASGYSSAGSTHWVSSDGLSWSIVTRQAPAQIAMYEAGYVGVAPDTTNQLLTSADGLVWETLPTDDLLPRRTNLQFGSVAGGPGGIAATAFSFFHAPVPSGREELADFGDGGGITIDVLMRAITLTVDGDTHNWHIDRGAPPDWVKFDLEDLTVEFSHPESEALLAAVSFDELRSLEEEHAMRWGRLQHSAFLFSSDGSEWSIQDLSLVTDESVGWVTDIVVGQDDVYLLVQHRDGGFTEPSGFSVWRATIP